MNNVNYTNWYCYQSYLIPSTAPHEDVDITLINDKSFWKSKKALAARWTSEFDKAEKSDWWYVIKDDPFDISKIKAKRRYEINKGMKNFEIKIIDPEEYREDLYNVFQRSLLGYPKKYRSKSTKQDFYKFIDGISKNKDIQRIYGAFCKENRKLCGYLHIPTYEKWAALSSMKTDPLYEKKGINAAIIYQILLDYDKNLSDGYYISDGQRTINHQTNFQSYLEKYFSFRKAYCTLNVKYSLLFKLLVKSIYPFKIILKKFDRIKIIHNINSVLQIECCARKCLRQLHNIK